MAADCAHICVRDWAACEGRPFFAESSAILLASHRRLYRLACRANWGAPGRLAQLVEHLVYTERVGGSSPSPPTSLRGGVFVTSIMSRMNRLMPIFAAAMGILALVQLFVYLGQWLSKIPAAAWLAEHARFIEWTLSLAAVISGLLVALCWLRATGRMPQFLT